MPFPAHASACGSTIAAVPAAAVPSRRLRRVLFICDASRGCAAGTVADAGRAAIPAAKKIALKLSRDPPPG
ncbi:hypothetical protein Pen01_46080 [Phytomonospora endophytica]|nr:hypothetical protein Pen01_46080 [Phytomonospora endophytica]